MHSPDWKDADSYEFNPETLPYREFAWEFLRRNPSFRKESQQAFLSNSSERERVAAKYGLRDLLSHEEPSGPGLVWLAEALCEPLLVQRKGQKVVSHVPQLGEAMLVFNLDATVSSGPAAIDALLSDARAKLMAERIRYIETLPTDEVRVIRIKTPIIQKAKLLTWLRTYDAVEHMGVSQKEAARVLYPQKFERDKFTNKTKELNAQKQVSDDRIRALSLVDNEYLALVPMDHLQPRSKRKTK